MLESAVHTIVMAPTLTSYNHKIDAQNFQLLHIFHLYDGWIAADDA
jgi:hypothetical protein